MADTPVQTTYARRAEPYVNGQIADTVNCDVDTGVNVGTAAIPFGRVVQRSGATRRGAALGAASAGVIWGVCVQDERLPASNGVQYGVGERLSILWRGDVAVQVNGAVTKGGDVTVHDDTGELGSAAAGASDFAIPNAVWLTAAADNGIAIVRFTGIAQSA